MRSIATVNLQLPTIDDVIQYTSEDSLTDFDIVIFDPTFPYLGRIEFSGGGSCLTIESGAILLKAMAHWRKELRIALEAGKTVFVLLSSREIDSLATGSTAPRKNERLYQTSAICNYDVLPFRITARNAKGTRCFVNESSWRGLFEEIKDSIEYRVILEYPLTKKVFSTKDGTGILGGVLKSAEFSGHLVLLPYFECPDETRHDDGQEYWTDDALKSSRGIVGQLLEIDRVLRSEGEGTPKPNWLVNIPSANPVKNIQNDIEAIDRQLSDLQNEKKLKLTEVAEISSFSALLFENGPRLEAAIENTLKLLGYEVENFRDGDLEIDHLIISPSGLRMIGEAEGKDTSAVGISKFRQLESNINEDFDRAEVEVPAKGILFGNGYRLTDPGERQNQFTDKCLKNAERLGTALVRTSDLYEVVLHVLNHPEDESFRQKCRAAIESTNGKVVVFPI